MPWLFCTAFVEGLAKETGKEDREMAKATRVHLKSILFDFLLHGHDVCAGAHSGIDTFTGQHRRQLKHPRPETA